MCQLHTMPTIKFKRLHPAAVLPTKAHASDACFDVYATTREIGIGWARYGLGFATEIPVGWQAKFYPRSSICKTDMVLSNGVGVIDAGYRGEWQAFFLVETQVSSPRIYQLGDRIGQIQFERVAEIQFEEVDELPDSTRGGGGFGSTGS